MLGRTDRRLRMVALLVVFTVFGSAAMLRLSYWQVIAAPELVDRAVGTMAAPTTPSPARAEIIDRDGVTLAQSASFDRLDANPRDIAPERRAGIVATLTDILDLAPAEQSTYLAKLSSGDAWDWLDRRLTPQQSVEVALAKDAGLLPGIVLEPIETRVYPRDGGQGGTSLASQLLGFVAGDSGGAYGVERLYDARLDGTAGKPADIASIAGMADAVAGETPSVDALADIDGLVVPPLRLTIDARLQRQVEIELNTARLANDALSASAVVMDPYTGAILASASVPAFDANDYGSVAQDQPELLRDRVVSGIYEPGSVMKAFTVAAALEAGAVTPQTKILDQPRFRVHGGEVRNSGASIGLAPVRDIIARSRNVGTSKIAFRMAPNDHQKAARILFDLWDRVGMVGKTGVDLASEESGIWYDPDTYQWAEMDLANRSFGQGVGVTLMHLATGYATLVNGGYRVQPHVVVDGEASSVAKVRVLSAKVAAQVRDILTYVTGSVPSYARGSLIPGYLIGGKTGTAQIWDTSLGASGGWKRNRFNHSFVGFVGANRPEVLIAVRIEEAVPKATKPYLDLNIESYELFQMIARGAIKHLDIKRSRDPYAGLPIPGTEAAREPMFATALKAAKVRARQLAAAEGDADERARPGVTATGERQATEPDQGDFEDQPRRRAARDAEGDRQAASRSTQRPRAHDETTGSDGAGARRPGDQRGSGVAREAGAPRDTDA
jgi:cell division protein FtsI/penicillin-binding protein 2